MFKLGESSMTGSISQALTTFLDSPQAEVWEDLPFFRDGSAERICAELDRKSREGAEILPPPAAVFSAFSMTPFHSVKAVILGQDPYPTPGDAHGLAFSYRGSRRIPASLKTILDEVRSDIFGEEKPERPSSGDLSPWARQGVLLLNTALTVEAKNAGAHLKLGWSALTDQAIRAISDKQPSVVFLLWGGPARAKAPLINTGKHLVIKCGHPSPLNRLRDFRNSRPFSRANAWLESHGQQPIDWGL
jgi:uracil-DNA glycosylase